MAWEVGMDEGKSVVAIVAHSGDFVWRCEHGQVTGSLLLTPTLPPRIQTLQLQQKAP